MEHPNKNPLLLGDEIQILLKRVLPWLTGWQRSHCTTMLVKLAGNMPSSAPEEAMHREVSHFATKLPNRVASASLPARGAAVNCILKEPSIREAVSAAGA